MNVVSFIFGDLFALLCVWAVMYVQFKTGRLVWKKHGYDGQIVIGRSDGKKVFSLELNGDPEKLENNEYVSFKVLSPQD